VKLGDNLTRLARNAGTTPAELARLNGVDEKELAKLKVGQTIKLPTAD
jgi:LysM repeat protein